MARSSSGVVAGLTAAAIAVVGFLAYQASAHAPDDVSAPHPGPTASAGASHSPAPKPKPNALPAGSGTGERVVYSLAADRVWLVGPDGRAERTYAVTPSTVDPRPGTYKVTSRSAALTGSDGVPIEHVVLFTSVDGVPIGFSAAVDGATPTPDPARRTGGIRESRADGAALWKVAGVGEPVVVVK